MSLIPTIPAKMLGPPFPNVVYNNNSLCTSHSHSKHLSPAPRSMLTVTQNTIGNWNQHWKGAGGPQRDMAGIVAHMHYMWNQRLWDDMHCYIHFFSTSKSTNGHIIHEVLVLTFPLHKTLRQLTSRLQVVNNGKQKGLKSMLLKNLSLARQLSIIGCFKLKVPGVKIKN